MPNNSTRVCQLVWGFLAAAAVLPTLAGVVHAAGTEDGTLLASVCPARPIDIEGVLGLLVSVSLIALCSIKRRYPELGIFPVPPSLIPLRDPSRPPRSHRSDPEC